MKAKLKLYCTDPDHEDFGTVIQDVFLGPIPYMTSNGTFVINGAERVVVSQLHRSPGVFFGQSVHANGTLLYSARIIPFKGSWIEFATDINNVMYAYIDRKKKLPVTTLLRAIGFETDKEILQIFDLAEEVKVNKAALKKVIGCKLALSDDRCSFPTELEILRLINQVRLGGFTSGKHGILHIHLGNLKTRIDVLHSIVDQYPSLISYISPTHCSRTRPLFDTCVEFAKKGGMMDISTGGTRFTEAHQAVALALEAGAPLSNLTFSSDGHGGVRREDPVTGEVTYTPAPLTLNYKEMVALVRDGILPLESALQLVTANPARNLSLRRKGRIAAGCDADFVALNEDLSIHSVYAKGKKVYES